MNNNVILIDGIIDNLLEEKQLNSNGENRGRVFEQFAISELLKTYDLSEDQLLDGIVDGKNDGGIDGFYCFINGIYISDKSCQFPKTDVSLEIYILTCKHHSTYELSPLESLDSTISELLDFSKSNDQLKSNYNDMLLLKRENLRYILRKVSPCLNKIKIYIKYISRGNAKEVAPNIIAKGDKLKNDCCNLFFYNDIDVDFVGAEELLELYRKKRNGKVELPIVCYLQNKTHFVALVNLKEYYKFIIDSENNIKRYFFEDNVRDYLGAVRTNEDIFNSLVDENDIDFWLLNNGITMLVTKASYFDNKIIADNIQIVNGLQTSNSIYRYFSENNVDIKNRNILVKIISCSDFEIKNKIIQATNNQTVIPLYSLHANDKIQKDIEEILRKNNLYYERKEKYYQNLGISSKNVLAPLYIAGGYVSLVLKLPYRAVRLKSKFMNNSKQYKKVFNPNDNLNVWVTISRILKKVDSVTFSIKNDSVRNFESYLKRVRPIVSLVSVARVFGSFDFGVKELVDFNIDDLTSDIINEVTNELLRYMKNNKIFPKELRTKKTSNKIIEFMSNEYTINNVNRVVKSPEIIYDDYEIDDEFLDVIIKKLPNQPWPKGIHKLIARELDCPNSKVARAIDILIERKVFKQQINQIIIS